MRQQAVYCQPAAGYRSYGKSLLRKRGELIERSFAHCYDTGAMRRTHLRGHENILKRQLIHVGAFNLSLIFRSLIGAGTPRELRNRLASLFQQLFFRFVDCGCVRFAATVFFSRWTQIPAESPVSSL